MYWSWVSLWSSEGSSNREVSQLSEGYDLCFISISDGCSAAKKAELKNVLATWRRDELDCVGHNVSLRRERRSCDHGGWASPHVAIGPSTGSGVVRRREESRGPLCAYVASYKTATGRPPRPYGLQKCRSGGRQIILIGVGGADFQHSRCVAPSLSMVSVKRLTLGYTAY